MFQQKKLLTPTMILGYNALLITMTIMVMMFKETRFNFINQNNKNINSKTINNMFIVCYLSELKDIFPAMYTALSIALTRPNERFQN